MSKITILDKISHERRLAGCLHFSDIVHSNNWATVMENELVVAWGMGDLESQEEGRKDREGLAWDDGHLHYHNDGICFRSVCLDQNL